MENRYPNGRYKSYCIKDDIKFKWIKHSNPKAEVNTNRLEKI